MYNRGNRPVREPRKCKKDARIDGHILRSDEFTNTPPLSSNQIALREVWDIHKKGGSVGAARPDEYTDALRVISQEAHASTLGIDATHGKDGESTSARICSAANKIHDGMDRDERAKICNSLVQLGRLANAAGATLTEEAKQALRSVREGFTH